MVNKWLHYHVSHEKIRIFSEYIASLGTYLPFCIVLNYKVEKCKHEAVYIQFLKIKCLQYINHFYNETERVQYVHD